MREKVIISPSKIREYPMESIKDPKLIRRIASFVNEHQEHKDILDRINPVYAFTGLYPEAMEIHNIIPEKWKKEN